MNETRKPLLFGSRRAQYAVAVTTSRRAAVVCLVLAACLAMSGCSSTPTDGSTGGGTAGGGTSGQSDDGNTDTETDAGTNSGLDQYQGLPETFPTDIPLIEGDVAFGIDLGTGWSVVIPVADLAAAYADASSKLTGAGFTAQVDQSSDEGSIGVFLSDKYQINVTSADSPDYGPSITYVVVING